MNENQKAQAPESFLREIRAVSDSEKNAANAVDESKAQASRIIADAQAEAVNISAKS